MKIILQSILTILLLSINVMAETPTAPINAGTYNPTDTTVRLSFKDMSENEDGFKVFHNDTLLSEVEAKEGLNSYQHINLTNLIPSTLYRINIIAFNSDGESTSLIKSFKTNDLPNPPINPNAPKKPTNAGTYKTANTSTRMSFLDNSNNEDGFRIYHNDNVIATVNPKEGNGTHQYVTLTELQECRLYTIGLVAFNSDGESAVTVKKFKTLGCNQPPIINLGNDRTFSATSHYSVDAFAKDNDGAISSCEWKIDGVVSNSLCEPTWVNGNLYLISELWDIYEAGEYQVTLTVTDDDGATTTDSIMVTKLGGETEVGINIIMPDIETMLVGQTIAIDAGISDLNWDSSSSPLTYSWSTTSGLITDNRKGDYGHPGGFKTAHILYTATQEGNQTLTLFASKDSGGSHFETVSIQVISSGFNN